MGASISIGINQVRIASYKTNHNDFKSKYYLHFLKEPSPKYVIECLGIISLDYGIEIGLTQFGLSQYMDIFLHY